MHLYTTYRNTSLTACTHKPDTSASDHNYTVSQKMSENKVSYDCLPFSVTFLPKIKKKIT